MIHIFAVHFQKRVDVRQFQSWLLAHYQHDLCCFHFITLCLWFISTSPNTLFVCISTFHTTLSPWTLLLSFHPGSHFAFDLFLPYLTDTLPLYISHFTHDAAVYFLHCITFWGQWPHKVTHFTHKANVSLWGISH